MTETSTERLQLRTADAETAMLEAADENGIKEARLTYPSGWLWLARDDETRALVEALADAEAGTRYGTDDLAALVDLDPDTVESRVETLLSLGLLVADEGTYRVNEYSGVRHAVGELTAVVEATGAPDGESPFEHLTRLESVRLLLDALLSAEPGRSFTQEELHDLTGVTRKAVWAHVEKLVALSVLEESGDEYVLNSESPVYRWTQSLDAAVVGAVLTASHP
ncbi:hypothetical protein [Halorussus halophilus]|uniref:hypothetical protein n=1 Tax=Halorussus halophilus TaxID=2650975 RepID=UPI001300E1A0|nr:hypothetical protein [Halorussus halophilus]